MKIAVTGHRLGPKLGGYSDKIFNNLIIFFLKYLEKNEVNYIISGAAIGWDQAVMKACCIADIPFEAAIPFVVQENKWPAVSQKIYADLLNRADRITLINEGGFANWKFQKRNEYMVNNATKIVALWDGSSGGTANCIKYAKKQGIIVENLWDKWLKC